MDLITVAVRGDAAPAGVLGRVAVGGDALPEALAELGAVGEVVVLSTCHRTEVHVAAHDGAEAASAAERWFERRGGREVRDHLETAAGPAAARDLFEVAAGLRSPVLGDRDVVGQVRAAWQRAASAGAAGAAMDLLFRHAIVAARRVHGETGLGRAGDSVSAVVGGLVSRWLPDGGGTVLVVGAGDLGAGIAAAVHRTGAGRVVVANRTLEKAREVAGGVGGTALGLDDLPRVLTHADAACFAVGPPRPLLDAAGASRAVRHRSRPLLVVDVGTPRAVEPGVSGVDGLRRLDLGDVRRLASRAAPSRQVEVRRAGLIVDEVLAQYEEASRCRHAARVLAALHQWAEEVRSAELERAGPRLQGLTPEQAAAVEALTRRLTGKLLHAPSVCVRQAAGDGRQEWLAGLAHQLLGRRP
ncbi:MAG TPA: glutamyl-tRNA reductase [Acidimicrobiales bacterium]|nr:glutamyl-tRNA reductase [Acidimicrobiales bacterium]